MSHSSDDMAFDSGHEEYNEKKHRTIFSSEQKQALERMFLHNPFPDKKQREELAASIGVSNPKSVDYWFGHRRAKNRQHLRQQEEASNRFHTVPQSHRASSRRHSRDSRDSSPKVPDYYRDDSPEDMEDPISSFATFSKRARSEYRHRYNVYERKPAVPQLVSTSSKRKAEDYERPENHSLEELWVACLLNQFYVDAATQ